MSADWSSAPFVIEPRRGVKLRGRATREGRLWTLVADGWPAHQQTGYDLVKAQKALEARIGKAMGARV